ncbi:hypothetical protein WJX73_003617 [Symbiochloris irregularis]|uniref:Uncharacterized protein n=1 Tax=Symbiochloris irregularis TaxID=706552 RepID=A0AAW1P294_9CHLO
MHTSHHRPAPLRCFSCPHSVSPAHLERCSTSLWRPQAALPQAALRGSSRHSHICSAVETERSSDKKEEADKPSKASSNGKDSSDGAKPKAAKASTDGKARPKAAKSAKAGGEKRKSGAPDGPFTPIVNVVRDQVGQKNFNQIRGKAISLHSQVIKQFGKQIGADSKQVQGLIRLAKSNGSKLGFLS